MVPPEGSTYFGVVVGPLVAAERDASGEDPAPRGLRVEGDRALLRLSDEPSGDREEALEPATLRRDAAGALTCDARGGRLTARLDRDAAHALAPLLGADDGGTCLEVGGARVRPPAVAEPVSPPRPPRSG